MNKDLLNILACLKCNNKLIYDKKNNLLICKRDKISYPILDGIPIMLLEKSIKISHKEIKNYE